MAQLISYWKMAFVRAIVYMLVTGGTTFLSITETYSDATWKDLGHFSMARIFATCGIAAFSSMLAFLDQTMGQLRNGAATVVPVTTIETPKP